ncbi:MAG: hypothetical protein ACI308_11485 [Muribaculaceae bacterium]
MTKTEMIQEALTSLGYKPIIDDDNDIYILYQMKNIFFFINEEDEDPFVSVTLPRFTEIEEGEETLFMTVCNHMTREIKLLKVYIDRDMTSISATCEFFFTNMESLRSNIEVSLKILGMIRSHFRELKMSFAKN